MLEKKTATGCCDHDYCAGWNDAVDAMPRWISVKERLPTLEDASANDLVICVCRGEDDKPIAEEVHAWHVDVVRRMAPCFTHWMPMNRLFSLLPEPTEEE